MIKNQKQLPKKGKCCYLPYDAIYQRKENVVIYLTMLYTKYSNFEINVWS